MNEKAFIIAAPSGTGKTTIIARLLAENPDFSFSISTTTRPSRPGEIHGKNYYFVTVPEFDALVREDAFVEWAKVHGNCYGTTKKEIDRIAHEGKIPLFDVDVQGAATLREKIKKGTFIFIIPPSIRELERRLRDRRTESEDQIRLRIGNAVKELENFRIFDYIIVNDVVESAVAAVTSVIRAEALKTGAMSARAEQLLLEAVNDYSFR